MWSFGIVAWEIFSGGMIPYPDLDNSSTRSKVVNGYRMPQPEHCPDEIYKIMLMCWKDKPEERPTFSELNEKISTHVESISGSKAKELEDNVADNAVYYN